MKLLRAFGMVAGAAVVLSLAAGAAYLISVLRLWDVAVQSTDPLDATEPA